MNHGNLVVTTTGPTYTTIGGTNSVSFAQLSRLSTVLHQQISDAGVLSLYANASEKCGGVIMLDFNVGCLPYLKGNDHQPIPLYSIVDAIDEFIDYDHLKDEFPTLSYGQLSCAIDFLRKLAQFNTRNIDIGDMEDSFLEGSTEFQQAIARALSDQEDLRVLSTK